MNHESINKLLDIDNIGFFHIPFHKEDELHDFILWDVEPPTF
jgi:hypothetical protein